MNLIISGPTATGKSDLAIRLATELNGEVINLDSVQVYKGFDIGSGKLSLNARGGIPHHLIDVCDPSSVYNGAKYVKEARKISADIKVRGKIPIFCGGTTLWLSLFVHGLAALPSGDPELREELSKLSLDELQSRLLDLDPESATRIDANDRRRLERAIETSLRSGKTQSALYSDHAFRVVEEPSLILVLLLPRSELYKRIDFRTEKFFKDGIIEEAGNLKDNFGECVALKSLSYPEAISVNEGRLSLENAISHAQQKTRRYAKRQVTFWRNEPTKRGWTCKPHQGEGTPLLVGEESMPLDVYEFSKEDLIRRLMDFNFSAATNVEVWRLDASALEER